MSLRKAQRCWWWTKSHRQWSAFQDSAARGYETLRRLPKFFGQPFFIDNQENAWPELSPGIQSRFLMDCSSALEKLGLLPPRVQLWVDTEKPDFPKLRTVQHLADSKMQPKPRVQIVFDCRFPTNRLVASLKRQLRQPNPIAIGTRENRCRRTKSDLSHLTPKAQTVKEKPIWHYTSRPQWCCYRNALILLEWPLAELSNKSDCLGDKILSSFTSFIKDKPPEDFRKHRKKCRARFKRHESAVPTPRTLALGLMVLDIPDIPKLARWLQKHSAVRECLGLSGSSKKIRERLRNARAAMRRIEAAAAKKAPMSRGPVKAKSQWKVVKKDKHITVLNRGNEWRIELSDGRTIDGLSDGDPTERFLAAHAPEYLQRYRESGVL